MIFSDWFYFEFLRKNNDTKPNSLRVVFTSDRVEVGVVSGVVSATESESEQSERFYFCRLRLRLRRLLSAYELEKTRSSESEAEVEG